MVNKINNTDSLIRNEMLFFPTVRSTRTSINGSKFENMVKWSYYVQVSDINYK